MAKKYPYYLIRRDDNWKDYQFFCVLSPKCYIIAGKDYAGDDMISKVNLDGHINNTDKEFYAGNELHKHYRITTKSQYESAVVNVLGVLGILNILGILKKKEQNAELCVETEEHLKKVENVSNHLNRIQDLYNELSEATSALNKELIEKV